MNSMVVLKFPIGSQVAMPSGHPGRVVGVFADGLEESNIHYLVRTFSRRDGGPHDTYYGAAELRAFIVK